MDTSRRPSASVSNLVPVWEEPTDADGGSYAPAEAAVVVEQVLQGEPRATRLVSPPEQYDPTERSPRRSFYEIDVDSPEAHEVAAPARRVDEDAPEVDYDLLHRREIAKQLLRARLVHLAEQREHRSAYELVFIMLAAAVAILLAAPPLVQVLLAARGIQA